MKYRTAPAILLFLTALGSFAVGISTPHSNMVVCGGLLVLPTIFAAVEERKKKEERVKQLLRRREEEKKMKFKIAILLLSGSILLTMPG